MLFHNNSAQREIQKLEPMMKSDQPVWAVTRARIDEAVRRIVEVAHPVRVILFGSWARGEADRDSDVDLIVVEREVSDRYAEIVRLMESLRGLIMPAEILVISARDYDYWSKVPGSVYRTAQKEGKSLYEAV